MAGRILSVCISSKKGTKKKEVNSALLIPEWGIEGDAHAGKWERQVSLLSAGEVKKMKEIIPDLKPGDFAENIIIEGLNLNKIKIGDEIMIGNNIILTVSKIGKECHTQCQIKELTGKCIMPEKGIFTRVLKGGRIEKGSPVEIKRRNTHEAE
ncbi:MAG: MOSC domain-containing protein [Candidatus Aminicenantales bacterium]